MSVTFSDVWLSYGEREVLRGIDLELTEHRVGIVGANGSGKSSLARLVNGLVRPTRGRVVVDGVDVARNTAAVRRRVGFLFSDADSQIVMPTVREDLEFSLRGRGLAAPEVGRRVDRALVDFGLADHADHPCYLLSGGQKQQLALAAVLLLEPAIVVADEPTTLLDLRNQRRFADRLAALPQQVLLATHHLELLAGFDRVVVLDQGRVVADGAAQEAVAAYLRLLVDVPTADGAPVAEGRS
jgi:biotin transport system ATP-binding protein